MCLPDFIVQLVLDVFAGFMSSFWTRCACQICSFIFIEMCVPDLLKMTSFLSRCACWFFVCQIDAVLSTCLFSLFEMCLLYSRAGLFCVSVFFLDYITLSSFFLPNFPAFYLCQSQCAISGFSGDLCVAIFWIFWPCLAAQVDFADCCCHIFCFSVSSACRNARLHV